ncbi:hypothetical protein AU190_15875 [Mycolicibacterium acapulense]|uniref:Uncharacterized protein n=1 Tax=Mycobacterium lehmannii TaxID=2048550 RepID=A0A101A4G7_9MYCO|nr:hypothetical protein AU190_15875 [Mycolicibacterium acapulense]KUI13240.1 hypothetical protein AU192_18265 [Mycobacterium lehmannii]KUI13542.1 hypothetical protein AU191_10360 [Mycolicibacterium acapulense]
MARCGEVTPSAAPHRAAAIGVEDSRGSQGKKGFGGGDRRVGPDVAEERAGVAVAEPRIAMPTVQARRSVFGSAAPAIT